MVSSPAVANGVVYVGSWDGKLYALDARTGRNLWSYYIANAISGRSLSMGWFMSARMEEMFTPLASSSSCGGIWELNPSRPRAHPIPKQYRSTGGRTEAGFEDLPSRH